MVKRLKELHADAEQATSCSNNSGLGELLPCPFCGCSAKIRTNGKGVNFIACVGCPALMGEPWATDVDVEELVFVWNLRPNALLL